MSTMTFGELFELYYARHAAQRTRRPDNARYFFQRHGRHWASTPITSLTRGQLQDWVDDVGAERGKAAANRAINLMAAVINWGIKRGYLPSIDNPCRGVERFKVKSRERFVLPHELDRLKAAINEEKPVLRDFFWMLLLTAARRGNVLAMRWQDVDTSLAVWRIPETKNGDSQYVALSHAALAVLNRRINDPGRSDWVFPGKGKDGHLKEPKRAWQRILKRAGLENLRIHDLRRTVGSYMAIKGADGFLIAKALGHKDLRSTQVYARMNLEPVRQAIEAVQGKWLA
jgi:integrase